jgi:lactoylglutathione lyase
MPRVCVIQINVNDMQKAVEFYSDKLGFAVGSREHYPDIVRLDNETVPIILYQVEKEANVDYPRASQTLINIETDDLRRSLHELRQKGVTVLHDTPQECPVGIYAAIQDPSGNVLELIEYNPDHRREQ